MKELWTKLYSRFRDLILYGIIGCLSSGLDFVAYTLLVKVCDWHYIVANCVSVLIGITTSFTLNRKYNFKVTDNTMRRFAIFLTVGLSGMALSNVILWLCIDVLSLGEILSKLLSIVLVVFFQFLLNKYITFRQTEE